MFWLSARVLTDCACLASPIFMLGSWVFKSPITWEEAGLQSGSPADATDSLGVYAACTRYQRIAKSDTDDVPCSQMLIDPCAHPRHKRRCMHSTASSAATDTLRLARVSRVTGSLTVIHVRTCFALASSLLQQSLAVKNWVRGLSLLIKFIDSLANKAFK
eukprot:3305957-Amphidinium_carterae.1